MRGEIESFEAEKKLFADKMENFEVELDMMDDMLSCLTLEEQLI